MVLLTDPEQLPGDVVRARFVSPWYPDYALVHSGIFVVKQVEALRDAGHDITVDVPQIFPAPPGPIPRAVTEAMRALAGKAPEAMFASADGTTYIPTPVPTRAGHMGRAEAMRESLALRREIDESGFDLIHAHLGMPTAWAVMETREVPLVVTEHQSTLGSVLAEPAAAAAYGDVLRRAGAFVCVSNHLRDLVVETLGDWAGERIEIVPNIVDLEHIPFKRREKLDFSSWVYVGGLMAHKGVQLLVRTFARYVKDHDPDATLTLVGNGPLRRWVEIFATSRGLGDSVMLTGSVPHEELGAHLDRADVMVHLSPAETFGIAPLEGIGAGMPVVGLRNFGAVNAWGDIAHHCGLLLDLDSGPEEIADAIAELRGSPQRLDLAEGRRKVEERYSGEVVAGRLLEIYQRVLG